MSFEKTAHGHIESKLQLQKSVEKSLEQSANSTTTQLHGVEKSVRSSESVSSSTSMVSSSSHRKVTTSSVMQSVKIGSSISSTEITEIEL